MTPQLEWCRRPSLSSGLRRENSGRHKPRDVPSKSMSGIFGMFAKSRVVVDPVGSVVTLEASRDRRTASADMDLMGVGPQEAHLAGSVVESGDEPVISKPVGDDDEGVATEEDAGAVKTEPELKLSDGTVGNVQAWKDRTDVEAPEWWKLRNPDWAGKLPWLEDNGTLRNFTGCKWGQIPDDWVLTNLSWMLLPLRDEQLMLAQVRIGAMGDRKIRILLPRHIYTPWIQNMLRLSVIWPREVYMSLGMTL